MSPHSSASRHRSRSGFTLVEILIASTIALVAIGATMTLMVTGMRFYYIGRNKVQLSKDIRTLALRMMTASRGAADFRIYDNFSSRTIATNGAGDMVAFLYADPNNEANVVRVVTYYRDLGVANDPTTQDQTLREFDTGWRTSATFDSSWLPATSTRTTNHALVETTDVGTSTQTSMFQSVTYGANVANAIGISGRIVYITRGRRLQNNFDFIVSCRS